MIEKLCPLRAQKKIGPKKAQQGLGPNTRAHMFGHLVGGLLQFFLT